MSIRTRRGAPLRLPVWFTVLAGIPLAALGWLGWRLLVQERGLEQQRQRERLEEAAATIVHDLDRALARWEERLPSLASGAPVSLPPDVVALVFDDHGVQRHVGPPLPYYPRVPSATEAPGGLFAEAESSEFARGDFAAAEASYRRLTTAADPRVRAAALMRLARTLRKAGRTREAIATYDVLATIGEAAIAGTPSELVARRERHVLLKQMGDTVGTARESVALHAVLASGRYRIDRPTFEFYQESIATGMPGAPASPAATLARAVDQMWARFAEQPAGRASVVADGASVVAVWRRTPAMAAAVVGRAEVLATEAGVLTRKDLHVSLEDPSGVVTWGSVPGDQTSTARTARETGLPWTVRVAPVDGGPDQPLAARRRSLLVGAFALMALVVAAASYAVFRAVDQELGVARLQSDFVATVSHEFRSPLTAMRHLTELLEDGQTPADRVPHYYRALGKETRRLQALVESLLDFGRMEEGRRTYQMEEIRASAVAARVIEEFADSPFMRRIEWTAPETGAPAHTGAIRADRDALALALRNLVDNALKYSPDTAPVRLSVHSDARSTRIAVADEGPGVPRREQRDIFRKFVRGTAAGLSNSKGTGIGLAIADHIVRDHGGRLTLESEPGRGSCFTIVLPTVRPSAVPVALPAHTRRA
jgi:two-component system phosphate regulon sensor histidine kinase PhoR